MAVIIIGVIHFIVGIFGVCVGYNIGRHEKIKEYEELIEKYDKLIHDQHMEILLRSSKDESKDNNI